MGGAVLGGKTDALIMGALRWVYNPEYSAIILRREQGDLRESIDRARDMYGKICPTSKWIENRQRFEFPSGATVLFGSAQHEEDIEDYKTFEFSYIGFDELTTFTFKQYVYMLSRNRAPERANLPLHVRAGTNPDGPGHEWVYKRFVKDRKPYRVYRIPFEVREPSGQVREVEMTRQFIPSTVFDNPHAGSDEYIAGLRSMGKDLADALLYGKWDYFRGQMFPYPLEEVERGLKQPGHYVVRCMDYGWSNPSAIYWLVVYPAEDMKSLPDVEVAHELVVQETNVDGIASLILQREERLKKEFGLDAPRLSEIDPSAAKSEGTSGGRNIKDMLQESGVWFTGANNDRQSGWAQMRRFMEGEKLKFWKGECPYLLDTLPKLVRDPKKADDIRGRQDDHGADALRYGLHSIVDRGGGLAYHHQEEQDGAKKDRVFDKLIDDLRHGRVREDARNGTGLPGGF